jgi:phenylalanyl-tRNA synthetase beta chain
VLLDGQAIGFVGELHPQWRQGYDLPKAPVLFELDLDAVLARQLPKAQAVSRLQRVERDLAVWVAEAITHDQVMAAVNGAKTQGLLKSASLFDIYRPKPVDGVAGARKSMAIRMSLGSDEATLTDEQVDVAVAGVLAALQAEVGGELRA